MFIMHQEGIGLRRLSRMFEISKTQVWRVLRMEQRAQRAVEWRKAPA